MSEEEFQQWWADAADPDVPSVECERIRTLCAEIMALRVENKALCCTHGTLRNELKDALIKLEMKK